MKVSNLSGGFSPFLRNSPLMGQTPAWQQQTIPDLTFPGAGPGNVQAQAPGQESSETSCYTCGPTHAPRPMTDAMAAMVPGGCTKLDPSECAAAAQPSAPVNQPGLHPGQSSGQLDISLTVFRADTEVGIPAHISVELIHLDHTNGTPTGSPEKVYEGDTDRDGKLLFHGTSPAPAQDYQYRITASNVKGSPSFRSNSITVQAYQPNDVHAIDSMVVVCPDGVNDLLCEVGEKQLYFSMVMRQQMTAWNITADNDRGMSYAVDTAHFFMAQMAVRNPILAKYWTELSWGVSDLGIPPSDWPDLLKNYDQVQTIFNQIAWPADGDVQKLFKNCARGLPIYDGMPILNFRLYSRTYSDYFPREDYKIRADMAASYLLSIHMIFQCMVEKLQSKAKSLQRHLASLSMIRLMTAFIFAPLTGGAMLATLATEGITLATSVWQNKQIAQGTKGVIAGVVKTAGLGAAAVGASLFAAGAGLLVSEIVKGADPAVQKIAQTFGPKVAEAASKDILENVLGKGEVSGMGLTTAEGLGTAGAGLAVEAMLSLITLKGVKDAKQFQKEVVKVSSFIQECATPDEDGHLCAQITPFVLWCTEALMLAPFFDHIASEAGIPDADTNGEIQDGAKVIEDQGVSVPSSATTPGAPPPFLKTPAGSAIMATAGIGAGGFLALLLTGALK